MAGIVHDRQYDTLHVRQSLVIPVIKGELLGNYPERCLAFHETEQCLVLKTKSGWRAILLNDNRTQLRPSAPPEEIVKVNIHKDCLEITILGNPDEDHLLLEIHNVLENHRGKVKKIQIKDAKDKLTKEVQKLIERMVRKTKMSNNGSAEIDL